MLLSFDSIPETVIPSFRGGTGRYHIVKDIGIIQSILPIKR